MASYLWLMKGWEGVGENNMEHTLVWCDDSLIIVRCHFEPLEWVFVYDLLSCIYAEVSAMFGFEAKLIVSGAGEVTYSKFAPTETACSFLNYLFPHLCP